jgi:formylglycine-generating enzyme required for sulfatase activity
MIPHRLPSTFLGVALSVLALCLGASPLAAAAPELAQPGKERKGTMPARELSSLRDTLELLEPAAVLLAVDDLIQSYGPKYPRGAEYRAALQELYPTISELKANADDESLAKASVEIRRFRALASAALLANPVIDFDRLAFVKRSARNLGLPANWNGNSSIPREGYDNEIVVLSPVRPGGTLTTLFKPPMSAFVGDLDLAFDGSRMLFSMPGGDNGRWHIWEIATKGKPKASRITRFSDPDVDAYDGAYLPDGGIVFMSSATYQGVPCVGGSDFVANLYRMEGDGSKVRRLCYDQEMNWSPMVMNDGRVLYTRWEYTDAAHYFSRLLFSMNPDGTGQQSVYGSNSYWPNSIFYARQVPGAPSKIIGVVSGHHGEKRMGELVLFDLAKGRAEADGVVQRIPGRGKKVEPVIKDALVANVYPRFLHPHPLNEKYFLVSCQPNAKAPWGIYLADVFDNLVPICEMPEFAMLEPTPLKATTPPPVIPERVNPDETEATVLLSDVYSGPGLAGIPRGSVKRLRVFSYHFTPRKMGGHDAMGIQSGWEVKRILGTVPVESDGSACFKIPANTPVALQPLDADGRALQLMRSWFTAQRGEVLSCTGCHESQNSAPPTRGSLAAKRAPSTLTPWYGPARPFAFPTEVQPVLDRNCVSCHDGKEGPDHPSTLNFAVTGIPDQYSRDPAYLNLHRFVRRPGPESDFHLFKPMEYHARTSELVQLLEKGHHGVTLSAEDWDRLNTWIDLNAPWRGSWNPKPAQEGDLNPEQRRRELSLRYSGSYLNPDDEYAAAVERLRKSGKPAPVAPAPKAAAAAVPAPSLATWPFDQAKAVELQKAAGPRTSRRLDLGGGVALELALIPAGRFVMGTSSGDAREKPASVVVIEKAFWMGRFEISNQQYARFDAAHDSRYIDQQWKDHTTPGYPANLPAQPVIRSTWSEARAFCDWLSKATGEKVELPSEAQWEWACRAGGSSEMSFGDTRADFSKHANLADHSLTRFAVRGVNPQPMPNPGPNDAFIPRVDEFNDGAMISAPVGSYQANAWGLHDMHGNVAEWTRSLYKASPGTGGEGSQDLEAAGKRVVRGGSWRDRPQYATASYRLGYETWQPVYNVGFRVIIETR